MSRAADHYQRLARQVEGMDHHRALLRSALGCLFTAVLIVVFAAWAS